MLSQSTKQKFTQALQGLKADAPKFYAKLERQKDRWNLSTGQNLSVAQWLLENLKRHVWGEEISAATITAEEQGEKQKEQAMEKAMNDVLDQAET